MGALESGLRVLLAKLSDDSHEYLLLSALKEVLAYHAPCPAPMEAYVADVASTLETHSESKNEGVRNMTAECMGACVCVCARVCVCATPPCLLVVCRWCWFPLSSSSILVVFLTLLSSQAIWPPSARPLWFHGLPHLCGLSRSSHGGLWLRLRSTLLHPPVPEKSCPGYRREWQLWERQRS